MAGHQASTPGVLTPYADDTATVTIAGLTVENGRDKVALYGSLDLTRDKVGLRSAQALKALLDGVVRALEGDAALPDAVAPPQATTTVRKPVRVAGVRPNQPPPAGASHRGHEVKSCDKPVVRPFVTTSHASGQFVRAIYWCATVVTHPG